MPRELHHTTMKQKFVLTFLILYCCSFIVIGQNYKRPPNMPNYDYQKWHFGFTLGPDYQNLRISNNSADLTGLLPLDQIPTEIPGGGGLSKISMYSEIKNLTPGFHVGIITSRRLGEHFNIRVIPSLSLGSKEIQSTRLIQGINPDTVVFTTEIETTKIKSNYISCPVLIKYKAIRIDNARPYLIAGANFKYDLATDTETPITLKKFDTSLEFGIGSDFYMQTFRLGIEIRFGIGLFNMLTDKPENTEPGGVQPYLTKSMSSIRAKTFTIAFNFE